jgi:hypothetical protein
MLFLLIPKLQRKPMVGGNGEASNKEFYNSFKIEGAKT